jgi:hypothetical protein
MDAKIITIAAGVITLLSLFLKFLKLKKENISIFADIQKKNDSIMQKMLLMRKTRTTESGSLERFRLAISDWFTAIAIVIVSYLLLFEYINNEMLTRADVFQIGLLFTLLLFNILFMAFSIIERRLGYWIDEFNTMVDRILDFTQSAAGKKPLKKQHGIAVRPASKKKRK